VLSDAFALADRLNAKLVASVGDHDVAEVWRTDGATSMTAWLRHHTRQSGRQATRCARTARRLRELPVTAATYRDGLLSGGQVQAIVANLKDRTVGLFAHHETELVGDLAELSVGDTGTAMQDWARRAEALLGDDPDHAAPERSLHLSRILDGRRELSGSFDPEAGAVIDTALRLAATPDLDGEPARSPAQRRADARVDVCRRFLDHQRDHRGGRHRPHLNIVTTLNDLEGQGPGRLLDGTILDAATLQRLFCDAGGAPGRDRRAVQHLGLRDHHPHRPRESVQRPGHPRPALPLPRLRPTPRVERGPSRPLGHPRRRHRPRQPRPRM
jgi:hypothetical protein